MSHLALNNRVVDGAVKLGNIHRRVKLLELVKESYSSLHGVCTKSKKREHMQIYVVCEEK